MKRLHPECRQWISGFGLFVFLIIFFVEASRTCAATPVSSAPVSANDLRGKVIVGYQGWFDCPGDDLPSGIDMVALDRDGCNLPNDWYLRLTGQAGAYLKAGKAPPASLEIALKP
jgi:hypothetical protein